jgi:hypothetical protein
VEQCQYQGKYPVELRERSVRLVAEARDQDQSLSVNQAAKRIGERVGVNPDSSAPAC